jgi:ABC-type Zn uptake system ZnuABC Zn-binding protein ZnuA
MEERLVFLDQQITRAIAANKLTVANAIKRIKKIELKAKHHKTIKQHNSPRTSTGLTHIFCDINNAIQ